MVRDFLLKANLFWGFRIVTVLVVIFVLGAMGMLGGLL